MKENYPCESHVGRDDFYTDCHRTSCPSPQLDPYNRHYPLIKHNMNVYSDTSFLLEQGPRILLVTFRKSQT